VLEKLVHEKGGLLSINHDKLPIAWDYEMPRADCQEVWQSTWLAWNWIALERYQQLLAEIRNTPTIDMAMLSVLLRELRGMA